MAKRMSRNVFGIALKQAKSDLVKKLKERMDAQNTLQRLNWEIPNLEAMVRSLEAQVHPQPHSLSQTLNAYNAPDVDTVTPDMGFYIETPKSRGADSNQPTLPQVVDELEAALPATAKGGDWK